MKLKHLIGIIGVGILALTSCDNTQTSNTTANSLDITTTPSSDTTTQQGENTNTNTTNPGQNQGQSEQQSGEGQSSEGQSGEGQPGEGQSGEGQPGEGQSGEGQSTGDPVGPVELSSTTLWVIGDSTSCSFENDSTDQKKYYPRVGYGTQLANYFNDKVIVKNIAVSGRSSGSYFTDKTSKLKYEDFTANIKKGDYVLLAFGHNEQNTDERYSNPNLTSTDTTTQTWSNLDASKYEGGEVTREVSFKYLLTHYYIDVALEAEATPILATPIVRRNTSSDTLSTSQCHIWEGKDKYIGGDYPNAIRELATEKGLPLIDNTANTKAKYEAIGKDETLYMHAWVSSKPASVDNTHLNIYGAKWVAYSVANSLKNTDCKLKDYLLDTLVEPTKANDLVVNSAYVETSYSAPTTGMSIFNTTSPWMASAFGYLGSQPSTSYHHVTETQNGVTLQVTDNKGKIAGSADGILMYYQQIEATENFTLTATMKITQSDNNTQVGMGIMIRDDMYVDVTTANDSSIGSNYVACGSTIASVTDNSVSIKSTAYRKDTSLTKGSTVNISLNQEVNLSIVKNGNEYTVKFGDQAAVTYTVDLTAIDMEYVYAGVYVARKATVEFTNITITK